MIGQKSLLNVIFRFHPRFKNYIRFKRGTNAADKTDEEIFKDFGDRLTVVKNNRKETANLKAHKEEIKSLILDINEWENLLNETERKWTEFEKTIRQ